MRVPDLGDKEMHAQFRDTVRHADKHMRSDSASAVSDADVCRRASFLSAIVTCVGENICRQTAFLGMGSFTAPRSSRA